MNSHLSAVINFCSNDYPFLRPCIDAVKPFSAQILIPVCDHFFDGKKEDRQILNQIYAENPDVQFLEFAYDFNKICYSANYWHNLARLIATFFVNEDSSHVLFLDCDEIADAPRLYEWLKVFPYQDYAILRLLNYWYFRESKLQAITWEDTPLLARKDILDGTLIMNEKERAGMYDACRGNKMRKVAGLDNEPLFHHYSWVRTKKQLLRKTSSWGHNRDRNWKAAIEEEFARPFNGKDFVHGYTFKSVQPSIEIDLLKKPKDCDEGLFSHVRKLSIDDINKIELSLTFQIPVNLKS